MKPVIVASMRNHHVSELYLFFFQIIHWFPSFLNANDKEINFWMLEGIGHKLAIVKSLV